MTTINTLRFCDWKGSPLEKSCELTKLGSWKARYTVLDQRYHGGMASPCVGRDIIKETSLSSLEKYSSRKKENKLFQVFEDTSLGVQKW
jgi:hypothetical protein